MQIHAFGGRGLPGTIAKRPAAAETFQQLRLLLVALRAVHQRAPARRTRHRPLAQKPAILRRAALAPPQAAPAPIFRTLDHLRPQRVALNVTRNSEKMLIFLHWKALICA